MKESTLKRIAILFKNGDITETEKEELEQYAEKLNYDQCCIKFLNNHYATNKSKLVLIKIPEEHKAYTYAELKIFDETIYIEVNNMHKLVTFFLDYTKIHFEDINKAIEIIEKYKNKEEFIKAIRNRSYGDDIRKYFKPEDESHISWYIMKIERALAENNSEELANYIDMN